MSEAPKLFTNKPKKEQVKQFLDQQKQQNNKVQQFSTPSTSSSSMGAQSPSADAPQPPPHKESFARRYKFLWPMLLAVNLAVGAYLFMRTKKNDPSEEEEVTTSAATTAITNSAAEKPISAPPIAEPVRKWEPIPEYQQRELFKWMLEEKRKVKPKDIEERKLIDEEKSVLKQFIRAKSIPNIS